MLYGNNIHINLKLLSLLLTFSILEMISHLVKFRGETTLLDVQIMKFLWGRQILDFLRMSRWIETPVVAPWLKNSFAALSLLFPACLALVVMRKKNNKTV